MSIFASLAAPSDDEHEDDCARWDKEEDGLWRLSGRPCSCGQPDAPLVYKGSHVLASEEDERGGWVDLALIPAHVRFWRENPGALPQDEPGEGHEPLLRFGVNGQAVILTRRNVEQIRNSLNWWLDGLGAD